MATSFCRSAMRLWILADSLFFLSFSFVLVASACVRVRSHMPTTSSLRDGKSAARDERRCFARTSVGRNELWFVKQPIVPQLLREAYIKFSVPANLYIPTRLTARYQLFLARATRRSLLFAYLVLLIECPRVVFKPLDSTAAQPHQRSVFPRAPLKTSLVFAFEKEIRYNTWEYIIVNTLS